MEQSYTLTPLIGCRVPTVAVHQQVAEVVPPVSFVSYQTPPTLRCFKTRGAPPSIRESSSRAQWISSLESLLPPVCLHTWKQTQPLWEKKIERQAFPLDLSAAVQLTEDSCVCLSCLPSFGSLFLSPVLWISATCIFLLLDRTVSFGLFSPENNLCSFCKPSLRPDVLLTLGMYHISTPSVALHLLAVFFFNDEISLIYISNMQWCV